MPDYEAGICGSNQQRIVHILHAAGNFLGQQSTGDQTEAPVEPAADGGYEGYDDDRTLLIMCCGSDGTQCLLADGSGSHCRAKNQNQSHLHGECKQSPEAGILSPGLYQLHRTLLSTEHGCDEYHDRQNDCE